MIYKTQKEDSTSTRATRAKDFFYDNILKRSTQSFLLALVIVMSYVVFFAWMIGTAPKVSNMYNYDGLEKLTATFGLIVATVVGYYFGQRQVEEASERAKKVGIEAEKAKTEATEQKVEAGKAKTEATENKDKLKEELNQRM